jgi:activating signal cointegrator 1
MNVITLTQPYATLVAIGAKKVETRSWATSYRGPLAIHAAKGLGEGGSRAFAVRIWNEPFQGVLQAAGYELFLPEGKKIPLGAIVAVCELVEVYEILPGVTGFYAEDSSIHFDLTDQERAFGNYTPGRFAWLLSGVRALPEPIPARGALGLWNYEGEL